MNRFQRALYYTLAKTIRVYQRLFLDLRVWGREKIPAGPKIYVSNHITSVDGIWTAPILPDPVAIVNGPAYRWKRFAKFFDALNMINAMPAHRKMVVDQAVKRLQAGCSVYITPEGDCFEQFQFGRFYPGFARMYLRARVPIVPIGVVAPNCNIHDARWIKTVVEGRVYRTLVCMRGPFLINIGAPMTPTFEAHVSAEEQRQEVVRLVRERIFELVKDVRVNHYWLS